MTDASDGPSRNQSFTTTTMSTFSKLKQRRKEKENKSFTSIIREEQNDAFQSSTTSSIGVDQAPVELQPSSTIHASYAPEGLYEPLTQDLEIRVHVDESGKGRGIYNLRQRKPGTFPRISAHKIYHVSTQEQAMSFY